MRFRAAFFAALMVSFISAAGAAQQPRHLFFRVTAGPAVHAPISGRLLVILSRGTSASHLSAGEWGESGTWVAAGEIHDLAPGGAVDIDTDSIAFPKPFSDLPSGDYQVQAVLDVGHTYVYSGLMPGDLTSPVLSLTHWTPGEGPEPELALDTVVPPRAPRTLSPLEQQAATHLRLAEDQSAMLSRFWGRPVSIRSWVVLPPGYAAHPKRRYATVYWTHGFEGTLAYCKMVGIQVYERMAAGKMPPMIWVMMDEHLPTGTHEFANSVNNGPWGSALTEEYIPWIESHYRMMDRANGRFLTGHSSGGWASLQLQINYPKIFGGTWSTAPDPADFHSFTGIDLYAPHANLYHQPDGKPYPLVREHGKVVATFEQFARLEAVLGSYGGQISSFDWVFSPRGQDGRPVPMFDRTTGDVNPKVVAYWRQHYDLVHILKTTWPERGPYLKGKIHVYVGTEDTYYLNESARLLQSALTGLGADAYFDFRKDRTHANLYALNGDHLALMDTIDAQMYVKAHPHAAAKWKALAAVVFP